MRDYNHLTPSELAYIIKEHKLLQIEHFYFIFMDLLLKQVIQVPNGFKVIPDSEKSFEYETFIAIGPNFNSYQPLPHERIFIDIFNDNKNLRTPILYLLKFAFKQLNFLKTIDGLISKHGQISEYLKPTRILDIFRSTGLNEKGVKLKSKFEQELSNYNYLVYSPCTNIKLEEAVNMLKTKILLIVNLNLDQVLNWVKEKHKSILPFSNQSKNQKPISETQIENIKAINDNFEYFYNKMIIAIEEERTSHYEGFDID